METINIAVKFVVPTNATDDQIEEWVKYRLGYSGEIDLKNPICDYEIEAKNITII